MSTRQRQKAKNNFEKDIKLMNNAVFRKTMKNMRKHRNIRLVTTERRRNYQYQNQIIILQKFFTESVSAIEMANTQILVNKSVYLGLS